MFTYARRERDFGMTRALSSAERNDLNWANIAYDFLVGFAKHHRHFISEDVSAASKLEPRFPQPGTDRAWGSTYRRAVKNKIIIQDGMGRSARRHASICVRWLSLIVRPT